ncbi:MAG: hypothetical protein AB7G47_09935 [Mycolicibacterium sp.]|uniref:hypothetical protein n=1 Tax=Mycolicibacterium sp. TaxID=2320850 RepID=UPI003D11DCED
MKALITFLVFPLVVLAALTIAVYEAIASIPSWLLVIAIGYLLYRQCRRPGQQRGSYDGAESRWRPAAYHTPTAPVSIPPQTVVYLVTPDRRCLPERAEAPQRWMMN